MSHDENSTSIELAASQYTVIRFGAGDGVVVTQGKSMTIDEVAHLLISKVDAFDFTVDEFVGLDGGMLIAQDYEELLDVASLLSEVNLYQARLLWSIKVPESFGMPRMLSKANELEELRYLNNLAAQRTLNGDALTQHLLEQGDFMARWAGERRHTINRTDTVARLSAAA